MSTNIQTHISQTMSKHYYLLQNCPIDTSTAVKLPVTLIAIVHPFSSFWNPGLILTPVHEEVVHTLDKSPQSVPLNIFLYIFYERFNVGLDE